MYWQQTGYRSPATSEAGVDAFLTACASYAAEQERVMLEVVEGLSAAAEESNRG